MGLQFGGLRARCWLGLGLGLGAGPGPELQRAQYRSQVPVETYYAALCGSSFEPHSDVFMFADHDDLIIDTGGYWFKALTLSNIILSFGLASGPAFSSPLLFRSRNSHLLVTRSTNAFIYT